MRYPLRCAKIAKHSKKNRRSFVRPALAKAAKDNWKFLVLGSADMTSVQDIDRISSSDIDLILFQQKWTQTQNGKTVMGS